MKIQLYAQPLHHHLDLESQRHDAYICTDVRRCRGSFKVLLVSMLPVSFQSCTCVL